MDALEKAGFLAYARTSGVFAKRVREAREIISRALAVSSHPYVAFSGGKDSTVMLHLVREQRPETVAVYSHDEYTLPETDEYLASVPGVSMFASHVRHAAWFCAWDDPSLLPDGVEWIEKERLTQDATQLYVWTHGYDGSFVGLRAEENSRRRVAIKQRGTLYRPASWRGVWVCLPLAWWTWRDIWAYIVQNGVPYNRAYDRMSEMGIPRREQRIGPFANARALPFGQLDILRRGWPDEFNRFAARFPQAWEEQ